MALSRMHKISEICSKSTILIRQYESKPPQHLRQFRRNRNPHQDDTRLNPQSLETPFSNSSYAGASLRGGNLLKPFCFTVGFSVASFTGAAIWEYENMRAHAISMIKKPVKYFKGKLESSTDRSNPLWKEARSWWHSLSKGERVFIPICAANVMVFLAWRVPRLQPFMLRYFCSNPASKNVCLPMLLSTFSHYSGLHLLANMYVLHSFSTGAVHALGQEQFTALYLSAGVISSFTSYVYKIITKQPGLSLGASGAIMAVLGYVCTQYPDTRLGIILVPLFTFSAGAAIKFIVGLDTVGALLGWKFFDHAAHLGGVACGIFWSYAGNQYIWQRREPLLQYWHELRGSVK